MWTTCLGMARQCKQGLVACADMSEQCSHGYVEQVWYSTVLCNHAFVCL